MVAGAKIVLDDPKVERVRRYVVKNPDSFLFLMTASPLYDGTEWRGNFLTKILIYIPRTIPFYCNTRTLSYVGLLFCF